MARCSICNHAHRAALEGALRARRSFREIAKDYGVSKSAVGRHLAHMPAASPAPPGSRPGDHLLGDHSEQRLQADSPTGSEAALPFSTSAARSSVGWATRRPGPPVVRRWNPLYGHEEIDGEATAEAARKFYQAEADEAAIERLQRQKGSPEEAMSDICSSSGTGKVFRGPHEQAAGPDLGRSKSASKCYAVDSDLRSGS